MRLLRFAATVSLALTLGLSTSAFAATLAPPPTLAHDSAGILIPGHYHPLFTSANTTSTTRISIGGGTVPFPASGEYFALPCSFAFRGATTMTIVTAAGAPLTQALPVTVTAPALRFQGPTGAVFGGDNEIELNPHGGLPSPVSGYPIRATLNGVPLRGFNDASSLAFLMGEVGVSLPPDAKSGNIVVTDCAQTGTFPIVIGSPRFTQTSHTVSSPHEIVTFGGNYLSGPGGTNRVLVNGAPIPATDLVHWFNGAIVLRVPGDILAGQYHLTVRTGGGTSNVATITVTPSAVLSGASGAGWGQPLPGTAPASTQSTTPGTTRNTASSTAPVTTQGTASSTQPATTGTTTTHAATTRTITGPATLTAGGQGVYALLPHTKGAVAWASSNPSVLAVSPTTGLARAVGPGTATISAVAGGQGATKAVKVMAGSVVAKPSRTGRTGAPVVGWAGSLLGVGALLALMLLIRRRRRTPRLPSDAESPLLPKE